MASHRTIRRALDAAMAAHQLVSIERSLKIPDHPKAQWDPAPLGYKLKAITSISVGGRYLAGLQTISDLDAAARD